MAGQNKDAQTSILRRVVDRTPLHPAYLETFRPNGLNAAQFAARYFTRENLIIQRLLSIGGEFSPLRQSIARPIVARFTDFNQSFGPIRRALRPQPEHQPRRHQQAIEDGYEADSYESDSFDYSPEPAFYEQPSPNLNQYSQNYAASVAPWEGPLNSTPLPVARRIEFQPANLRYLTQPEAVAPVRPANFSSESTSVERVYRPTTPDIAPTLPSIQAPAAVSPAISAVAPNLPATQTAAPGLPTTQTAPNLPATHSQTQDQAASIQQGEAFAVPSPLQAVVSGENPTVAREIEAATGNYFPALQAYSPAYEAAQFTPTLPALSRALQRTFDAETPQASPSGLNTNRNFFQTVVPGASPAAVARHFAVPATIARYQAVKKAADKVFLGEQFASEAAVPSFEAQQAAPVYTQPQPLNPVYTQPQPPLQREVQQAAASVEPATEAARQVSAELAEVRRVREETRELLAAQPNTASTQTNQTQPEPATPAQPSFGTESQVARAEQAALPGFSITPSVEAAGDGAVSADSLVSVTPNVSTSPGQVQRPSENTSAIEAVSQIRTRPGVGRNGEATPAEVFRTPRTGTARNFFDAAIPASLLNNDFGAEENAPDIQRLTGNRLISPLRTSGWANQLPSLRNNPGVESAHPAVARQLNLEENDTTPAASSPWTDTGAGVYYDRRQVRRVVSGNSLDTGEAAYETQDRIYSLAEPNTGLANFQPQFMQALAAQTVAPAQTLSNRAEVNPAVTAPLQRTVADLSTSPRNYTEPTAPANQPLSREVNRTTLAQPSESALPSTTPDQANIAGIPAQSADNFAAQVENFANQADAIQSGLVARQFQPGQIETAQPATSALQAQPTAPAEAAEQSGSADSFGTEFTRPGRGQRTAPVFGSQPTALQRVFKRLDLEDAASPASGGNPGFDFSGLTFNYAAWPGIRQQRTIQREIEAAEDFGFYETAFPGQNLVAPSYREAATESFFRPTESAVTPPQFASAPETPTTTTELSRETAGPAPSSQVNLVADGISRASESGRAAQTGLLQSVQRDISSADGPGGQPSQPRNFANSLETAWLSPENRLIIERLPGGSGALQRLMQAPGQLQAFMEGTATASAYNLSLPSLRNNPGLTGSVARALEEGNATPASQGALFGGSALNFILRRRVQRQLQDTTSDFEGGYGYGPSDMLGFAPAQPGQSSTNGQPLTDNGSPAFTTQPATASALFPVQRTLAVQPTSFQNTANQETASRIQRNVPSIPGQPNPNGSFSISTDWINQLQRKFEGMSVGQLSDATGQIMRYFNPEGAPSQNFAGFGTGPDFTYTVPPLLLRKVSDYTPQGDSPYSPPMFIAGQSPSSYTSPGEVLRAYEEGATYLGQPDEGATQAYSGEGPASARQDGSARLDLPRLQQTHLLLQRIANLEKSNTSLELAHRMEAAAQANSDAASFARPNVSPLSLPAIQRPQIARTQENGASQSGFEAADGGLTPLSPLRMTDVPLYRPGTEDRFSNTDSDLFSDEDFARPAPEVRTIEIRVPDRQNFATPLEVAAARGNLNGPNIGQGEILQPLAIQRKASTTGPAQPTASYAPLTQPSLHSILKTSVGQVLDHPIQRTMGSIFGSQFHDVRVHTGDAAAQATGQVGAEAFTLGSDIYFAPGRYQPHTQSGQALIGHELTHVMQQSSLPSLGNGRIPETSSEGQAMEHHAIANEHLLLRHLSGSHDDHDHDHGFSSNNIGQLSFRETSAGITASRTIERSYQPVSEQNYNHQPINPSHLRSESGAGSVVQRVATDAAQAPAQAAAPDDNLIGKILKDQQELEKLARKVYQIMRDQVLVERDRGMGPGNNKFF